MRKINPESLLQDLTYEQKIPVLEGDGPVLIIAGAGTGKTRVLTYRIAYLLANGVPETRILALTFTNKAADEMRSRISEIIGWYPSYLFMGTFHSFCARILRIDGYLLGYEPNFTIYDREDQRSIIQKILKELGSETNPLKVTNIIGLIKSGREDVEIPESDLEFIDEVFRRYQKNLREYNAMDFDDLLLNTKELFQKFPHVRDKYAKRYMYILVDEYQDTNKIQFELLCHLVSYHNNLFVVGDEDQSIYGFRGANIHNILDFQKKFPNAKIFKLEQNFRSTQTILRAASHLLKYNNLRLGKVLWTPNKIGEKIEVKKFDDEYDEAEGIAEIILESKRPLSDFLVLFRTNFQSKPFEDVFPRLRIPFEVVGTIRFYERKEIKDIIAFFKALVNPWDTESFLRILNLPPRKIGEKTINLLLTIKEENKTSFPETMKLYIERFDLVRKSGVWDFYRHYQSLKGLEEDILEALKYILYRIGYINYIERSYHGQEKERRLTNIMFLEDSIKSRVERGEKITVQDFVTEASLRSQEDEWDKKVGNKVTLMTVHSAKGLEFPVVIVSGLEEGVFPHRSSFFDNNELEEERRLFHVALTRAKEKVYLTYAKTRSFRLWHNLKASRFLDELPEDALEGYRKRGFYSSDENQFSKGDLVLHSVFGKGYVVDVYDDKVEVMFPIGVKILSLKYCNLKILGKGNETHNKRQR